MQIFCNHFSIKVPTKVNYISQTFKKITGRMSLETLDRLGVPVEHPFFRHAVMAWWFVPLRLEPQFLRVLETVWVQVVTPKLASLVFAYFRAVVPKNDYQCLRVHLLGLMESLA